MRVHTRRLLLSERWPYKVLLKVIPLHTLRPLRYELHLAWVRLHARAVRRRFDRARDLLVNVGCGDRGQPGWVNVDGFRAPGVTCVFDCRSGLPFPDGAARAIFSEHLLEHLDYAEEAPWFLRECHRVLERGGVLRIIVPDAEQYLRAYVADGWTPLLRFRQEQNGMQTEDIRNLATKMELINELFRQGFQHRFAYDYETLELLLRRSGFETVRRQRFGCSVMPELAIDLPERAAESLYTEAIK